MAGKAPRSGKAGTMQRRRQSRQGRLPRSAGARARAALRESEERFRATFEQAAVGVAHTTIDGRFLQVNGRLCQILGYSSAELLALTTRDVTHPDDRDKQDALRVELLSGRRASFAAEKRYVRQDGSATWVNRTVTLARRPSTGEPYLIQVIEDISERKRTEARLERLTRARRVMAECNHVLIHAADEAAMLADMCRIVVESGGYKMAWVGFPTGDAGTGIRAVAHAGFGSDSPMTAPAARGPDGRYHGFMWEVITTGKPHIARDILRDPQYERRRERAVQHGFQASIALPLLSEGAILGAIAIYAREADAFDAEEIALLIELVGDIAYGIENLRTRVARELAEQRSRDNERRFRETFEQAAVGITRVDLSGVLIDLNEKFCSMLGYSKEELLGRHVREITHPEDYGVGSQYRSQLTHRAMTSAAGEKRFIRKDGTVLWARRTMSTACDTDGKPLYVISVVEDITERKLAEQALSTSQEMLGATFSQAAVGIFVSGLDARYLQVNDKYCDMVGYSRDELLCMSIRDVNLPGDAVDVLANRRKLIRGELSNSSSERQLVRKDGSQIWVSHSTSAVRNEKGEVQYFMTIAEDISVRKRAEAALHESEEQFRQLAGNIPQAFWITDVTQKQTVYISPAAEALIGRPLAEIRARPRILVQSIHEEDRRRVHESRKLAMGGGYDETYRIVRPDGSIRWVRDRAFPVRDAGGRVYRVAGIAEDITDRKAAEERLMHLAHYDVLTGLPNRVLFYDRLRQALAYARRHEWNVGVMFIDVDRFKNVNDTLGHAVGDQLLQQISGRLAGSVRAGDAVGRLGGDEFAIVLSNLTSAQDASLVAQKIMASFNEPFKLEGADFYVTASIGITLYPEDSDDQETLIKNADAAMYRAKERGRNSYQFYRAEMNARALELLSMESDMRRALGRGEFLLHFQPKASIQSGGIVGVEALLRWRHPARGLVLPGEFMPVLEETGLIVPVGEWVLAAACRQIKDWERAGIKPVPVAVNLSPREFAGKDLAGAITKVLGETEVNPSLIELEITESSLMTYTDEVIASLEALSKCGIGLSIDDFGTGYSSLSYLKRFPLDALKIDRSFVKDIITDIDDATITRAVISMAHSLGLKVIAEGVETEAQLAFLAGHGCDEVQGYYFARPLDAETCTAWLKDRRTLRWPYAGTLHVAGIR